jgi:hypothetical protein
MLLAGEKPAALLRCTANDPAPQLLRRAGLLLLRGPERHRKSCLGQNVFLVFSATATGMATGSLVRQEVRLKPHRLEGRRPNSVERWATATKTLASSTTCSTASADRTLVVPPSFLQFGVDPLYAGTVNPMVGRLVRAFAWPMRTCPLPRRRFPRRPSPDRRQQPSERACRTAFMLESSARTNGATPRDCQREQAARRDLIT